jgi:hypothetical protein
MRLVLQNTGTFLQFRLGSIPARFYSKYKPSWKSQSLNNRMNPLIACLSARTRGLTRHLIRMDLLAPYVMQYPQHSGLVEIFALKRVIMNLLLQRMDSTWIFRQGNWVSKCSFALIVVGRWQQCGIRDKKKTLFTYSPTGIHNKQAPKIHWKGGSRVQLFLSPPLSLTCVPKNSIFWVSHLPDDGGSR